MGKRKSTRSKVAPRKKAAKLDTVFCCPFCNHPGSVKCKIELKFMIATASCYICMETYSTRPHALTKPIDVYSEWIDECELVNDGGGGDDYA